MSQSTILDAPFDVPNEEGTPPITLLPPGKYTAQIIGAVVGPTKNGRGQIINFSWAITEGEFEKRRVFQGVLIEHDSVDAREFGRQKFKDICSSCGITDPVQDLSVLLFTPCTITLTIRKDPTGHYPDKNEVRNVLPLKPSEMNDKVPF